MRIRTHNSGTKYLIFGLLAGGTIGAALALLYAPEKGNRLRASLKKRSGEMLEGARDTFKDAEQKVSDVLEGAKRESEHALKAAGKVAEGASKILKKN